MEEWVVVIFNWNIVEQYLPALRRVKALDEVHNASLAAAARAANGHHLAGRHCEAHFLRTNNRTNIIAISIS